MRHWGPRPHPRPQTATDACTPRSSLGAPAAQQRPYPVRHPRLHCPLRSRHASVYHDLRIWKWWRCDSRALVQAPYPHCSGHGVHIRPQECLLEERMILVSPDSTGRSCIAGSIVRQDLSATALTVRLSQLSMPCGRLEPRDSPPPRGRLRPLMFVCVPTLYSLVTGGAGTEHPADV